MAKRRKIDDQMLRDFVRGTLDPHLARKVEDYAEKHPKLQSRIEAIRAQQSGSADRQTQLSRGTDIAEQEREPAKASREKRERASILADLPSELAESSEYEILKELGRGGMGIVYLAKNVSMDRLEVIKVLNSNLYAKDSAKQRFINEIQSGGKLNHPTIVTFYRVVPLENHLAFAMEYVDGSCLHQYIKANHPVPVAVACTLGQQIAAALQHAYENGLIHRDLKPANVMVFSQDAELRVKVLDFGLAKAMKEAASSGLTQDGATLGTPEYMAPEQIISAANADIRADIYSLGCTLYHLLTGRQPFVGTLYEVMMAQTQKSAPTVNLVRPDIPDELADIVARMMAKDPAERFQTPREVQQALKALAMGSPQSMPAPGGEVFFDTPGSSLTSSSFPASGPPIPPPPFPSEVASPRATPPHLSTSPPPPPIETRERETTLPNGWSKRLSKALAKYAIPISLVVVLLMGWLGWSFFQSRTLAPKFDPSADLGSLVIRNTPPEAEVVVDGKPITSIDKTSGNLRADLPSGSRNVKIYTNGDLVQSATVEVVAGQLTTIDYQPLPLEEKQTPTDADPEVNQTVDDQTQETPDSPKQPSTPSNVAQATKVSWFFPPSYVNMTDTTDWETILSSQQVDRSLGSLQKNEARSIRSDNLDSLLTASDPHRRLLLSNQSKSDGHLRIEYRVLHSKANASILLNYLKTGENQTVGYLIPIAGPSFGEVDLQLPLTPEEVSIGRFASQQIIPNQWHTVDVIFQGNKIQVWLDGRAMFAFVDRRCPTGRVGFYREPGVEVRSFQYRPLNPANIALSSPDTTTKPDANPSASAVNNNASSKLSLADLIEQADANPSPSTKPAPPALETSPQAMAIGQRLRFSISNYHRELVAHLSALEAYLRTEEMKANAGGVGSTRKTAEILEFRDQFASTMQVNPNVLQNISQPAPNVTALISACEDAINAYKLIGAVNRANKLRQDLENFKSYYPVDLLDDYIGPELIENGSFESVDVNGIAIPWKSASGNWEVEPHQHTSDLGEQYTIATGTKDAECYQIVDLSRSTSQTDYFLLSGMLKNDDPKYVQAKLRIAYSETRDGPPILGYESSLPKSEAWAPVALLVPIPQNAHYARVSLISDRKRTSKNYARFDNISFRPLSK